MTESIIDENGWAVLSINMVNYPFNMLNDKSISALESEIDEVIKNDEIKGAVITSKKKDFVVGADVNLLYKLNDAESINDATARLQNLYRRIETGGKPFVAAINGTALGGGYELALACHYRIIIDDNRIEVGLPEILLGLFPAAGGSQRLPRMIGIQASLPLLLEGKKFRPRKALDLGLVDELAENSEVLIERAKVWLSSGDAQKPWDKKGFKVPGGGVNNPKNVMQFGGASGMILKKTKGNYNAPKYLLSAIYEGLQLPFDKATIIERNYFVKCKLDPACNNMIRSLFWNLNDIEKGKYRPADVPESHVKKVGVLGAGMMGAGIAYASALRGIEVVLKDVSKEILERGKSYSQQLLDRKVKKGRLSAGGAQAILDNIKITQEDSDLEGCDLIVEAVPEVREIKDAVIRASEPFLTSEGILASNTSTLPISGLSKSMSNPQNFIGIHFFSPVDKMKLVEVIKGSETSEHTLVKSLDYIRQLKKVPIVVNDSRGFYTTRVFKTYPYEALYLLDEGVSPALIENLGIQAGYPVGPLAIIDELNLGLLKKILDQTELDLGEAIDNAPARIIRKFVDDIDRLGKKNGAGFYEYPESGRKYLWPKLKEYFPLKKHNVSNEEIKKRFLFIQCLEAVRCLEEGVLNTTEEGDIGSIFAWGFPPYYGGVFSYIDTIGVREFCENAKILSDKYGDRFAPPKSLVEMAAKNKRFYN
ncbi:MAG: 3-hydroxyacyl-CoA dehydrogenase NAD-binding domain-containing protein [Flavobacteriales bacterium]|nr:3-hydroxyacyl-CoA dehydrogenase NAD-binding domain-containing protein [Flavobacteriales bacterium]